MTVSHCKSTHLLQIVSSGHPQFRSTKSEDVSFSKSFAILLMCSGWPPATWSAFHRARNGVVIAYHIHTVG